MAPSPTATSVPTDKVVPIGQFNVALLKRIAILYTMFVVDDVLDASMLARSLSKLIDRVGWRKLGARLRRNPRTGALEHHIPAQFSDQRPPIRFHHVIHNMAKADHPLACKLPSPSAQPAVMEDPELFKDLWLHKDTPTKASQYLNREEPQLALFVVSFTDATVISVTWPHSLFDAVGLGEVLHQWCAVLHGHADTIPAPVDIDNYPLADLGCHPSEPYELADSQLSLIALCIYTLRNILEMIFHRPQGRMLYIPGPFIQKLRKRAILELSRETTDNKTDQFISEGDVLSAWWAQVMASHVRGSNKLINVTNVLGWRTSLEDIISGRPFISNCAGFISMLIPASKFFDMSLGAIAWQTRQCILRGRRREQIDAYVGIWRKVPGMAPPLFGNATMHLAACSNWQQARLCELDFSPAIAHGRNGNAPAFPSYVQSCVRGLGFSNILIVVGRDTTGGYWVNGLTGQRHWAAIEEAVGKLKEM